ncbi:winged helix DNA-binding domain-containing protein [Pedobacter sp. BS3]|uniref:winged helix DNA-binding domain-containing protein n=1 Tax=Pedobacter sp. BS3 TaxID=2567937 RepID=UPI0011EF0D62|nr:winged helix DNA-binding domain-containing protein [Pedobacter sp. BS3]TZF84705.1 winged helix DNA-binding domain-containing protein [Pedobacter sp. BS3]
MKDIANIAKMRLINQQIAVNTLKTAKAVVSWMGALQAQDYAMAKWALGIRLKDSTEAMINKAIDRGDIIRTHILRPTWHFVSADDIGWMLALTAPRIRASLKSRLKQLELTEAILAKSKHIMEKALAGNRHLTRAALVEELNKAGIATNEYRSGHILLHAELEGLLCSGAQKEKDSTYALLPERIAQIKTLPKDEALAKLAQIYFTSHGPATLQDFIWWSGLSITEAKHALEMIKPNFYPEKIDEQTYWIANSFTVPKRYMDSAYLLPAFDEFIIGYTDRSATLPFEHHHKAVSSNGLFRPTIVINGQTTGIWKRALKKDKVQIELQFFQSSGTEAQKLLHQAAKRYGAFYNLETELI